MGFKAQYCKVLFYCWVFTRYLFVEYWVLSGVTRFYIPDYNQLTTRNFLSLLHGVMGSDYEYPTPGGGQISVSSPIGEQCGTTNKKGWSHGKSFVMRAQTVMVGVFHAAVSTLSFFISHDYSY